MKTTTFLLATTVLLSLLSTRLCNLLMISAKDDLLETVRKSSVAVLYYGTMNTQLYAAYEEMVPSNKELFQGLAFYYIPEEFQLQRPSPQVFVFRNILDGDWVTYRGPSSLTELTKWVRHQTLDSLPTLQPQDIEQLDREATQNAFIFFDGGETELLRTKVYLSEFCQRRELKCWKVSLSSPVAQKAKQAIGIQFVSENSQLSFYRAQIKVYNLYMKDLTTMTRQDLLDLSEVGTALVPRDLQEFTVDSSEM